jgi:hypothetical protein
MIKKSRKFRGSKCDSVKDAIGLAIGEGSLCWNPRPKGVFDSSLSSEIVDSLTKYIHTSAFDSVGSIQDAMTTLKYNMNNDKGYVWGWYCNLVMMSIDSGVERAKAEDSASRFMKLCFNVEASQDMMEH